MEEYLPKYKSGDEGVIVNISSVLGLSGVSFLPVYIATKHAIIGLAKGLGTQQQYESTKVRVLTICPGATATPLLDNLDVKMVNERYVGLLKINIGPTFEEFPVQS